MTAPAARTLAEIVAEGRRLEAEQAEARRLIAALDPFGPDFAAALALGDAALAVGRFYRRHGPALLAVAEAAVEWEAADAEQRRVPAWSRDTDLFERMLFRYQSATRALRAAVRGEEKTNG